MTQQEQHQTYVPGQRDSDHDDEPAVGTAHAPYEEGDERAEETYPAATYASGSADPEVTDRDDVEVVDRDEVLAGEHADEDGEQDPQALDPDEVDSAYDNAVRENEVRDTEESGDTEVADDLEASDDTEVEDERVEDQVATAEADEDRTWAAEHATELRAGSTNLDEAEPVAVEEPADESATYEPVAVEETDTYEPVAVPVAVDDEPVQDEAEPVQDEPAPVVADSRPGSVDVTAVGAVWADGAVDGLRDRWRELQLRFIDDPRSVAAEADELVGEALDTITNALQAQRAELANWQNEPGDDTERLRAAVRGYRDYLDRLLGM